MERKIRRFHFLSCDDWEVIYLDGKKISEAHSHSLKWFLKDMEKELGIKVTMAEMTPEQVDGDAPEELE